MDVVLIIRLELCWDDISILFVDRLMKKWSKSSKVKEKIQVWLSLGGKRRKVEKIMKVKSERYEDTLDMFYEGQVKK